MQEHVHVPIYHISSLSYIQRIGYLSSFLLLLFLLCPLLNAFLFLLCLLHLLHHIPKMSRQQLLTCNAK
jgi:hypothetical protein